MKLSIRNGKEKKMSTMKNIIQMKIFLFDTIKTYNTIEALDSINDQVNKWLWDNNIVKTGTEITYDVDSSYIGVIVTYSKKKSSKS